MKPICVDASVWVAAADRSDRFSAESRAFFSVVARGGAQLCVPSCARVEIACALARRTGDPEKARELTELMLDPRFVQDVATEPALMERAHRDGPASFLRGADALYAAAARETGADLVSWDREMLDRAGAVSPPQWLEGNE